MDRTLNLVGVRKQSAFTAFARVLLMIHIMSLALNAQWAWRPDT